MLSDRSLSTGSSLHGRAVPRVPGARCSVQTVFKLRKPKSPMGSRSVMVIVRRSVGRDGFSYPIKWLDLVWTGKILGRRTDNPIARLKSSVGKTGSWALGPCGNCMLFHLQTTYQTRCRIQFLPLFFVVRTDVIPFCRCRGSKERAIGRGRTGRLGRQLHQDRRLGRRLHHASGHDGTQVLHYSRSPTCRSLRVLSDGVSPFGMLRLGRLPAAMAGRTTDHRTRRARRGNLPRDYGPGCRAECCRFPGARFDK